MHEQQHQRSIIQLIPLFHHHHQYKHMTVKLLLLLLLAPIVHA
jgi:hypothetical protein